MLKPSPCRDGFNFYIFGNQVVRGVLLIKMAERTSDPFIEYTFELFKCSLALADLESSIP